MTKHEQLRLANWREKVLRRSMETLTPDDGTNLATVYTSVDGDPNINPVLGPSYDAISESERYIQQLIVVAGVDYRVHECSEEYDFEVTRAAVRDGAPLQSIDSEYPMPYGCSFPGEEAAPPLVTVHHEQGPDLQPGFSGFWRGALCLDCGKDLPDICDERREVPEAAFARAVSEAFGAPMFQLGHFYETARTQMPRPDLQRTREGRARRDSGPRRGSGEAPPRPQGV